MWTTASLRLFLGLLVAVLVTSAIVEAQEREEGGLGQVRTVVIDPGHGGEDGGTVGVAGVLEKELTLRMALALRDELERRDPNLRVILTREDDTYPTLDQRTHLANLVEADLLVSIHFNAAENPLAHGIETFFIAAEGTAPGELVPGCEESGPAEPAPGVGVIGDLSSIIVDDLTRDGAMRESAQLAEFMQSSLLSATSANDRQVRQGRFRILRGARMPAVVVELGFLTHEDEGHRVLDPKYQEALLQGLADAIVSYDEHLIAVHAELGGDDTRLAHR